MLLGQSLLLLFLFSVLVSVIGTFVQKNSIKKEYEKSGLKNIISLNEFREKYYNRI